MLSVGALALSVLVFSSTAGFRHEGCISEGTERLEQRFDVDATEDARVFTRKNLKRYDVVVFLCTTGDVLNPAQQRAFERYKGGFVGIHSAADTEYDWPFYGRLVGAYFESHPAPYEATLKVERRSLATRHLGRTWTRTDEWYSFRTTPKRRVLLSLDGRPMAWCRGRAFYTALGHDGSAWAEPAFRRHVFGGVRMAAGKTCA